MFERDFQAQIEGGRMAQGIKIDRGRSVLNAADEIANPYGLILSEKEREYIYGSLNRIDNRVNAILNGKKGWTRLA
jgi:hypothetical protein